MPGNENIQSIQRAMQVLYAVAGVEEGRSVDQIAQTTGLKLHTAYKIIRTLEAEHFLFRTTNPLRFQLGHVINELYWVDKNRQLLTEGGRILTRAQAKIPCANFALVEQQGTDFYERIHVLEHRPGTIVWGREKRLPLYGKASTLLFLAFSTPEEMENLMRVYPFEGEGAEYWGSKAKLLAFLRGVRETKYSMPDIGDVESPGVRPSRWYRLAAPVFSPGGRVLAAISAYMFATESKAAKARLMQLCRKAADELSRSSRASSTSHSNNRQIRAS